VAQDDLPVAENLDTKQCPESGVRFTGNFPRGASQTADQDCEPVLEYVSGLVSEQLSQTMMFLGKRCDRMEGHPRTGRGRSDSRPSAQETTRGSYLLASLDSR
jgi:hypothetical protein